MNLLTVSFLVLFTILQLASAQGELFRGDVARIIRLPPQSRSDSTGLLARLPGASGDSDTCHQEDSNVCAELIFGDNTVGQQIRIDDNGCTPISNAAGLTAINVFNCWCGLWNAADETACNNGDDDVVDQLSSCAGLTTRDQRGWKSNPTHISCFRLN